MRLLLDTHVWIWSQESPQKLGSEATRDLTDVKTVIYVSPVSSLEIARLIAGGRVALEGTVDRWIADTTESLNATTIEISHRIATAAYGLPEDFHKDPADRLLVATARAHDLRLLTADERILGYRHVETQDARI